MHECLLAWGLSDVRFSVCVSHACVGDCWVTGFVEASPSSQRDARHVSHGEMESTSIAGLAVCFPVCAESGKHRTTIATASSLNYPPPKSKAPIPFFRPARLACCRALPSPHAPGFALMRITRHPRLRAPTEQSVIANVGALSFAAGCSAVASAVAEISPHVRVGVCVREGEREERGARTCTLVVVEKWQKISLVEMSR